ncbi:MAG: alpha/beta hydrolase [Chloroflexota bacterium]
MATEPVQAVPVQSGYASVNDLEMYYEIHGTGAPLVVVHGSFMSTGTMSGLVQPLAATRQVIAVDLQAHGRTADRDLPLNYAQMADDVAALLDVIGVGKADVFGYSMGGAVAQQVAIRHPERVNKLVLLSTAFSLDGWYPEVIAGIAQITPQVFAGSPIESEYQRIAPQPEHFPALVKKVVALNSESFNWSAEIAGLQSPALIMLGDSDGVRPEHAAEMFRLFGGGVFGDYAGLPKSRFAVLPGATHVTVMFQVDRLVSMINDFLDPQPAPQFPPAQ